MSGKLTDWRKGQRVSAAHLQEAWSMLRRIATVMGWDTSDEGNTNTSAPPVWKLGRISAAGPAGEADYTDERYWIREVYILHGTDPRALLEFENFLPWDPGDGGDDVPVIHTVTNLPELTAHSHNLAIDTPVLYLTFHDAIDDTDDAGRMNTRNIMVVGGAESKGEFIGMDHRMVAQNVDGWGFDTLHSELT